MCFPSLFVIVFIKTIYTEVVKLSDLNESDLYESSDNLSSSQFFDSLNIEDKTKDDSNVQISLSKTKSSPEKIKRRFSFSNKKKQNKKQNIFFEKLKELKEKIEDDSIIKEYKMIVPFDYENKGVLEPNKEFSGFIQQFIAIKEMLNSSENENMLIKDISMNYLYVSHPIFVNLYSSVCGFTGTVGTKYDKQIFRKHYKLSTKKIPRNAPNHRINLPVILCSSLKKRNEKIVEDVIGFHMMNNPVLVIFKDLNEIFDVYHTLRLKGINNINVFDGKNEKIKPDKISGLFGAVSLGTNVCGRGTDIKEPSNPLHVIVTYYTSNSRVINQAFGRTARQGNEGTVRVICLFDQYNSPQYTLNEESTEEVLKDFSLKNELQIKFIDKYKEKRQWIFDSNIKSQKLSRENIKKMRDAKINVNRIKAYNNESANIRHHSSTKNILSL